MSNDYFNNTNPLTDHTLGRAAQVNNIFDSVMSGFDLLPGKDALNQGRVTYYADSGAANVYVVTMSPAITSYVAGLKLDIKIGNTNTGASTLNVNSLGAKAIKTLTGEAISAGDLTENSLITVQYDGADFRITSASGTMDDSAWTPNVQIVDNKAAALLISPTSLNNLFIKGDDGGMFYPVTGGSPGDYLDDGGSYCGTVIVPTGGDGSTCWQRKFDGIAKAQWWGSATVNLYVSTAGSDTTNYGYSSGSAFATIQKAIDTIASYGRYFQGTWKINLAAGTYAGAAFPDEGLVSEFPIYVQGPDVSGHPNVPTAIIKEGVTQSGYGLEFRQYTQVYVKDILIEDYNGSTASAGIVAATYSQLTTENVHFEDCYSGIWISEFSECDVNGGLFNDCGYLNSTTSGGYGIRALFNCKLTIGSSSASDLTEGPEFTNSYICVFAQEGCVGHLDWCTLEDSDIGVRLVVNSRLNMNGSSFKRLGTACWATDNSIISPSTNTTFGSGVDANTQNFYAGGGTSVSSGLFDSVTTANSSTERCVMRRAGDPISTINATTNEIIYTLTCIAQMWRETYSTARPAPCLRARIFGELSGTTGWKRIQIKLGAKLVSAVFTASETGAFEFEGTVVFDEPDKQTLHAKASRHLSSGGDRYSQNYGTEAMTSNTDFKLEAYVEDAADSIIIKAYEVFFG